MNKSIIVYGPQGCGKTRNAARIAKHFGLVKIIDGGLDANNSLRRQSPQADGVLYLTCEPIPNKMSSVRVVQFSDVAKEIGITTT